MLLVEAPRFELGSRSQLRKTLHAYSLLFFVRTSRTSFADGQVSEATRPWLQLVRLFLACSRGPKEQASSS